MISTGTISWFSSPPKIRKIDDEVDVAPEEHDLKDLTITNEGDHQDDDDLESTVSGATRFELPESCIGEQREARELAEGKSADADDYTESSDVLTLSAADMGKAPRKKVFRNGVEVAEK